MTEPETRTPTYTPCVSSELQPPLVPFVHFTAQDSLCLGEFDFATDSQHLLSATSPQMDGTGNLLVFDSWSIGGGSSHADIISPFRKEFVHAAECTSGGIPML